MKRVFTRPYYSSLTIPATDSATTTEQVFKAEEDMILVGWQLWTHPTKGDPIIGNDGVCWCEGELTPNSVMTQPGALAILGSGCLWNTTPAAVQYWEGYVERQFPDGEGIPIPEEGVINIIYGGTNTTAADVRVTMDVILYLIRGRMTK